MDELVHHCLRELAFDGDLGSNVSRLKDFIVDFYAHTNASHAQNSDDAFCAFVWALVVQQPTVMVGLVDQETMAEVWVAPQISAKRKALARGEEHVEYLPPKLNRIPEPKTTPLDTLRQNYGNRLRLAVEPDAIFAAVTGSHIRSSKLSPMVYSALQIITRGRDAGVTVVDLGKISGYDQKTCFYLVRQLTELNLVVKVRRGGVGSHFCIHKHFFDRNPSWKAIQDEETQAETMQTRARNHEEEVSQEDMDMDESSSLNFTPIDARHLSSLPLISGRVIRLLKASKNHTHASNNMLITLGFSNPTKTDRRFFQTRIREMVQQGLIEKVVVPNNRKKSLNTSVKCLRLVKNDASTPIDTEVAVSDMEDDTDDVLLASNGVAVNTTIHKQIINLLEDSGKSGMTLNDISSSLGNFDKRTIELLLARADKSQPPTHLSDLHIASLMETSGRERRHRYFTYASYRKLIAEELLDNIAGAEPVDVENAGGFLYVSEDQFYDNEKGLNAYGNTFKDWDGRIPKGKKRVKNPILPDGTIKRGRPRKGDPRVVDNVANKGVKQPKKRGRKKDSPSVTVQSSTAIDDPHCGEGSSPKKVRLDTTKSQTQKGIMSPRKRGRPPKKRVPLQLPIPRETVPVSAPQETSSSAADPSKISTDLAPQEDSMLEGVSLNGRLEAEQIDDTGHDTLNIGGTVEKEVLPVQNLDIDEDARAPPPHDSPPMNWKEPLIDIDVDSGVQEPSTSYVPAPSLNPPAKHPATTSSTNSLDAVNGRTVRVNVSHIRRENEILRLLENAGGIINIQNKEFYEGHTKLLESLAQAGEFTSSPAGTRIDKRTATRTINGLENKGRIKVLKTSITSSTGINRPTCIIYLPHVEQSKLNTFLIELAQAMQHPTPQLAHFVKIDERVDYGAHALSTRRSDILRTENSEENDGKKWVKNPDRAAELFACNDATIRDVLLTERTTMAQFYGFIAGKAVRCRQLHLAMIHALESSDPSPYIISHDKRIIDLSFFCQDISLGLYCSLISPLAYDEELASVLNTAEGRQTLLRDLPQSLQSTLQLGRSRSRSRILDMFEMLRSLELVGPLQPSISEKPFIICSQNGTSSQFDLASLEGWAASTPMTAPTYWHVHSSAPIRLWVASENRPPLWKTMPVGTHKDALVYWDNLQEACNNSKVILEEQQFVESSPLSASVSAARSLRRTASWRTDYFLSWHQMQYLKQYIDTTSSSTPPRLADGQERDALFNRICWVISAPRETVEHYFATTRKRLIRTAEKIRNRAEKLQKRAEESKLSLAKKAEEARLQREQEWSALLTSVHPEPLPSNVTVRIERIRGQFMQAGCANDHAKWRSEIRTALREAELATSKVLKIQQKRMPLYRRLPTQSTAVQITPSEVSIQELIELQGPPEQWASIAIKRKRKRDDDQGLEGKKKTPRRHRFQWNLDFDELARDASAIIRARCRNLPRLDWAAFEQVFPSVPRNTVRQRLAHIKETPGNDAYLRRLEDSWYDLWLAHKGSPDLPDEDPQSASNFDLTKHLEFLRAHIDKNALRVGFARATETTTFVLPSDSKQLQEYYSVVQAEKVAPEWDFMWNVTIEEGREKKLKRRVLSRYPEHFPGYKQSDPEEVALAEGILKMALGTPPERYNPEQASSLLKSRDDGAINIAIKNLLSRGILSKSQRDPTKQRPGRQLKISEINQNAIGGSVTRDTYQDAISLLEEIDPNDNSWHDWPLTATDGDCATLIELVSEDKVEFNIDTSLPRAARVALDWNSKKTDDDQIETSISVRYRFEAEVRDNEAVFEQDMQMINASENDNTIDMNGHMFNADGHPACCRKTTTDGLVDCVACLDNAWSSLRGTLDPDSISAAEWILNTARQSGETGIRKNDILALACPKSPLIPVLINLMIEADLPQIYWTGYESLVLVSAHVISKWSVVVSNDPVINVFPRRWLDIRGAKVPDFWQAALRAVMGLVIFRPGISQTEIRWRLRSVYDRQEVNDVLCYLHRDGYLRQRLALDAASGAFGPFDDEEERDVFWFIGERHWYQV